MEENKRKKKRSPNYTSQEKAMFEDILSQYKYIVEDKRTNCETNERKNDAWKAITIKFNANSMSGPRDTKQLKALYDTLKQMKRNSIGETNKADDINKLCEGEPIFFTVEALAKYLQNIKGDQTNLFTQEDLAKALQNIKEDKKEMNKTGTGSYVHKSIEYDKEIISLNGNQMDPLKSEFDSDAIFFQDNIHSEISDEVSEIAEEVSVPRRQENNQQDSMQTTRKKAGIVPKTTKKIKKNISANKLKWTYFKNKCQNAFLERRKLMQEMFHNKEQHKQKTEEHRLKIMILEKQLQA